MPLPTYIIYQVGVYAKKKSVGTRSSDALVQIRVIRSGSSYLSQNDMRAHFALHGRTHVDTVEVLWPTEKVDRLANVPADRIIVVEEGRWQ